MCEKWISEIESEGKWMIFSTFKKIKFFYPHKYTLFNQEKT